ncbi:MAG TPA: hypothetical protein VF595_09335 [Tepidisphaeraceae bacterium]|jgi:hypothetical protein
MELPKYWARASFTAKDGSGRPVTRNALGWSTTSVAEAQAVAGERAKRAADRQTDGRATAYEYGEVPPREQQFDVIEHGGQTIGVITRNRYGSLILNTDRVMFADIDFPTPQSSAPQGLAGLVAGLFKKTPPTTTPEAVALEKVLAWQATRPAASFRVYRTFAGLRLLFTDGLYDPRSPDTRDLLRSIGSDLLYFTLTQRQGCFRARLSPKPWRCGASTYLPRSIVDHPDEPQRVDEWAEAYTRQAAAYDTCRFLRTVGPSAANGEINAISNVHDRFTGATGTKPLA